MLTGSAQCRFAVLALVDSLNSMDLDETDAVDALQVVSLLAEMKQSVNFTYSPWSALAEAPSSLESLVRCLAERASSGAKVPKRRSKLRVMWRKIEN